ncbi:hypothetical protein CN692_14270 [Bacillus sp. AFS002410]|uniref:zinc-ribbon domain-containing protein n=1 Tax=Bacillus sp. AFS002410 TaxID=2033481 RepID=UPI000BF0EB3C|nr:zinc-ribbon domain-containing protein [Bacillus sp. AFS002410]PEJ57060.1 hypothetical protein CN692_14270 [Bacillus sp. AFS002410]
MNKYIIQEYQVPLIWAVKVKKTYGGCRVNKPAIYENIGEPEGPFMTGNEAARAIGMTKYLSHVSHVLNGTTPTFGGHRFYYDGEIKLTFKIPNVKYAKQHDLLLTSTRHTLESIEYNMKISGFDLIEIGKFKGTQTKVKVKCCNMSCDEIIEKTHGHFISMEQFPYCQSCSAIIFSRNLSKKQEKKSLYDVRPDLAKYYYAEDNDGIQMNEISHGSRKKIILRCDICNKQHMKKEIKSAGHYTALKPNNNGFLSNFSCKYCNSAGVKFPHLIDEWHEKNKLTPFDYSHASVEKVWWKCSEGHEWKTKIAHRTSTNKTNCPHCTSSKGEKAIAQYLDELRVEYIIEYPVKIGKTKARQFDFYIPMFNLFIEVHGIQHYENRDFSGKGKFVSVERQQKIDLQKQTYAEQNGYYMAIDYREHKPELALKRFENQFEAFLNKVISGEIA